MTSRIIAILAIIITALTSSLGAAQAGVLFDVAVHVGKRVIDKAVADKQERDMRAYQQQRMMQQRAAQQRAMKQRAAQQQRAQQQAQQQAAQQDASQALQAPPAETAAGTVSTRTPDASRL